MKKSVFFVFAICLLAACSQKETASDKAVSSSPAIYASIESSTTRTFIDDQLNVCWNAKDWIVVFNKDTYGARYIFDGNDGDTSGSFTIDPSDEGETNNDPLPYVYAAYPYQASASAEDGRILIYLWDEQEFTEGSFDPLVNIMVAASEDETLTFKNAVGILKLRLYGDPEVPIESVTIQGNGWEIISGDALVYIAPGEDPVIEPSRDGNYSCYIDSYSSPFYLGKSASEPLDLYFLLYPTDFEYGITITVESSDGQTFTYTNRMPLEIKRSVITTTAPLKVVFPEPICIDGNFADWDELDPSKVAVAECASNPYKGALKIAKVYADYNYVFIYVEFDETAVSWSPSELVPFHIYLNGDGNTATGGFGDMFSDACVDVLLEGFLTNGYYLVGYGPTVYKWNGEANGSGWHWTEILAAGSGICSGAGRGNAVEIRLDREKYPDGVLADNFGIGFDIQQAWESVGILPNVDVTADNTMGKAPMLNVTTVK